MNLQFFRTLGQRDTRNLLAQALTQKRFPHALLLHGEPGLGQQALLLDLAQILACAAEDLRPCRNCAACRAFERGAHEGTHYLLPLEKKDKGGDGELEAAQVEEMAEQILALHAQPYGFGRPEKAWVSVAQVRETVGRLAFAENRSRARTVIIPFLEALQAEAANALLKTLEEPPAEVYFLIASEHRAALLPTLLSRCLHLALAPLPPADFSAAAAALAESGRPLPARLLPFAEGAPGALLDLREDGEELLEESARFLSAAAADDWRVFAEYVDQGLPAQGAAAASRLLAFLLRVARLGQKLRAAVAEPKREQNAPPETGFTARALEHFGWDTSLVSYLGPWEEIEDFPAFVGFLEAAFRAIRQYCRPQNALIGLYFEYQLKTRSRSAAGGVAAA